MPAPQWLRDLDMSVRRYTTTGVRWLIYINLLVWIAVTLIGVFSQELFGWVALLFPCTPLAILRGWVWQFLTYMFLHIDPFHVFFNMLMLWFIGTVLEQQWGRREFLRFFLFCGVGAAIFYEAMVLIRPLITDVPIFASGTGRMIGASGAIYGLLFAFGYLYPDQPILFGMLIPMPARVLVAILIILSFMSSLRPGADNIAHFAHLTGMLVAWLYLRFPWWHRWGRRRPRVVVTRFRDL